MNVKSIAIGIASLIGGVGLLTLGVIVFGTIFSILGACSIILAVLDEI